jgi:hypothetical protein
MINQRHNNTDGEFDKHSVMPEKVICREFVLAFSLSIKR